MHRADPGAARTIEVAGRELGEDQADQVIACTQKCVVMPLDTSIALLTAELHREYRLATADAIVYATARHEGRVC